jgi:hypothetical protein
MAIERTYFSKRSTIEPTIKFKCSLGIDRVGHYKTTIERAGTDSTTIAVDMEGRMFVGIKSIERIG